MTCKYAKLFCGTNLYLKNNCGAQFLFYKNAKVDKIITKVNEQKIKKKKLT